MSLILYAIQMHTEVVSNPSAAQNECHHAHAREDVMSFARYGTKMWICSLNFRSSRSPCKLLFMCRNSVIDFLMLLIQQQYKWNGLLIVNCKNRLFFSKNSNNVHLKICSIVWSLRSSLSVANDLKSLTIVIWIFNYLYNYGYF